MLLNCDVGKDSWESLGLQGDPTSPVLNIHWKDWWWGWNSNTLAIWWEKLTYLKRPWCWERLKAGGEGNNRGWDDWMTSPTQWTWVWVNSGSWWWTGRPGVLQSIGSQRVGHDWVTELKWILNISCHSLLASRVSAERSAVKRMGFHLYVTCCFSLAAFNILSLCLVFVSLISMCLGVFLLGFILYRSLWASWTWLTIFFSLLEKFSTISSKIFSYPFFFS